jgi:hypothetical protein
MLVLEGDVVQSFFLMFLTSYTPMYLANAGIGQLCVIIGIWDVQRQYCRDRDEQILHLQ